LKKPNIKKYCKYHKTECIWTPKGTTCIKRREEQRNKHVPNIPDTYECKGCQRILPSSEYHRQRSKLGIKKRCKSCIKERDYARYNDWPGYIRKKIVASWSAHGNVQQENRISINEATNILEKQKYKCSHCKKKLQCTFGTQTRKNCWGASLDRINVDIIGYGNGNGQWLCMSCNNGKCTMADVDHREKFASRDREIRRLKLRVNRLLGKLRMNMNAVQRLDVGGSEKA